MYIELCSELSLDKIPNDDILNLINSHLHIIRLSSSDLFYIFINRFWEMYKVQIITINPKDKPWMNIIIKAKLKEWDKWHKRWKSFRNDYYHKKYKQKRIEVNISMMQAKCSYYEICKENLCNPAVGPKQYCHLIKSLYGIKIYAGIPTIFDGNDVVASAKAKAELFNKNFLKKSTLAANLPMLPALEVSSQTKMKSWNVYKLVEESKYSTNL